VIGVFAAQQSEVEACPAALRSAAQRQVGRFTVFEGDVGFVCRTGMGPIAEEATRLAVDALSPRVVLSVGTCGGLNGGLSSGEIVLCERVHEWTEPAPDEPQTITADAALVDAATQAASAAQVSARTGASVSIDTPAWGPGEKRALREWMGHDVVEMESFWIGRVAAESRIPYLAIRVITDGHDETIPNIPGLIGADGTVDQSKLLEYTRDHPEAISRMAEMHRRSEQALANLRTLLDAFIPSISQVPS
jgi:adenosylhomocysteine nucleosidase